MQFVDLQAQYQKYKTEIDAEIHEVLDSSQYIMGGKISEFENNLSSYTNAKHSIGCSSGTDALLIALMALDLDIGDEVITTPFTFIATAEVIALLGLTPVFVDVDPHTFTLNIDDVAQKITPKTKAVVPVHLFGQTADMERLMPLAKEHGIYVIEDTCQAIGTDYHFNDGSIRKAGTIGDLGGMSFFPSKNLGAFGDGGAIFTNSDELATKCRSIANHGMTRRYHHDDIGVNSRLDTIQAAILDVKLKYLDDYIDARQKAAAFYDKAFEGLEVLSIPSRHAQSTHVFHQYTLLTRNIDREKLMEHLAEQNISSAVYYPVPIHFQDAYRHLGYRQGALPVTEKLSETVISLPIHTEMNEKLLATIAEAVIAGVKKLK
jgi:dTDP-4-amino-4,6-dideoxygalactose transaminase